MSLSSYDTKSTVMCPFAVQQNRGVTNISGLDHTSDPKQEHASINEVIKQ